QPQEAVHESDLVIDDEDPFAELDQAHRSAPPPQAALGRFSDDDDGVSLSTRDALAAARAAVRASLEGGEARGTSALGSLKSAPRSRDTGQDKQKGSTLRQALKA